MKTEILNKLKDIKLFLFDLDGVLIRNNSLSDYEKKIFFQLMENTRIQLSEQNKKIGIVTARNEDKFIEELRGILKCGVISSSIEKVSAVDKLVNQLSMEYKNVFYAGDDILDIPLLKKCGLSATPASARREVKRVVNFTFKGTGAEEIFNELLSWLNRE